VTPIGEGLGTGVVASALGFADLARAEAQAVVDLVTQSGASRVIVMSVSDRYAFEHVYGARLGIAWPDGVAVTEVTTVLADALAEGRLTFRSSTEGSAYAYHDPCNSPRLTRDPQAPRALLAAALGDGGARRLFWRENRAHPCGSVGALAHTHPDLAAQLSDARLADAAAAGAAVLVTDDPACLHHLQSRSASGVSVAGLYQLLAGQLAS
jgi:Fe-S oxidoreductase